MPSMTASMTAPKLYLAVTFRSPRPVLDWPALCFSRLDHAIIPLPVIVIPPCKVSSFDQERQPITHARGRRLS
jgi:hypothetical protein